jgi:hypothetical protein
MHAHVVAKRGCMNRPWLNHEKLDPCHFFSHFVGRVQTRAHAWGRLAALQQCSCVGAAECSKVDQQACLFEPALVPRLASWPHLEVTQKTSGRVHCEAAGSLLDGYACLYIP